MTRRPLDVTPQRRLVVLEEDELERIVADAAEAGARRALDAREPSSEFLDAVGAGAVLGIGARAVQKLAHREGFPAHHIGRSLRFKRSDLLAWMERQRLETKESA